MNPKENNIDDHQMTDLSRRRIQIRTLGGHPLRLLQVLSERRKIKTRGLLNVRQNKRKLDARDSSIASPRPATPIVMVVIVQGCA